jgi:hypothetical protein
MGSWIAEHWFTFLNAVGIVGSLFFTSVSLRSETKTRRIANLLTLTQNHREVWSELLHGRTLARVLEATVDLEKQPVTTEEGLFINIVIQHLASAYEAIKTGLAINPEGLSQDLRWFFSLPIPSAIWEKVKPLQNHDFVAFVDRCRARPELKVF